MFKNLKLFGGWAKDINEAIENVNKECVELGIKTVYDVRLGDNLCEREAMEELLDGHVDIIEITANGVVVERNLVDNEALIWCSGFIELANQLKSINKK